MSTLIERIDDTQKHLAREGLALVSRTRRAGDGLAKAITDEAHQWQVFLVARRDLVRSEVGRLTSPRGVERAALRLADQALRRAQGTVQARLGELDRELGRVARAAKAPKAKKARPAAKRARSASRRLVTDPAHAS